MKRRRCCRSSRQSRRPPRQFRAEIPRDLETICLKCLHRVPARRYLSMTALADDLRRWQRGEPIQARAASAFERGRLSARAVPRSPHSWPRACWRSWVSGQACSGISRSSMRKTSPCTPPWKRPTWSAERAEKGETAARGRAYAAQINLADQFRQSGRPGLLRDLLNRLRPAPGEKDLRGFEWHFLWNAGRHETHLPSYGRSVAAVAYLGDGRRFVSVDNEGAVLLWETDQARLLSRWDNHPVSAGGQVFSADGGRFVSITSDRGLSHVRLCDLHARQDVAVKSWPSLEAYSAILSPDGGTVAIRGRWEQDEGGKVRLWVPKTGSERILWRQSATNITHFAFSPDGATLAIAYHQPNRPAAIECIDVVTGTRMGPVLTGHRGIIRSLAFSPDGRDLASACDSRDLKVWDLTAGHEKCTLRGHKEPVSALAFSGDGAWLAAGTSPIKGSQANCSVCVWDLTTGGALHVPPFHPGVRVSTMAFSPKEGRCSWATTSGAFVCMTSTLPPPPAPGKAMLLPKLGRSPSPRTASRCSPAATIIVSASGTSARESRSTSFRVTVLSSRQWRFPRTGNGGPRQAMTRSSRYGMRPPANVCTRCSIPIGYVPSLSRPTAALSPPAASMARSPCG